MTGMGQVRKGDKVQARVHHNGVRTGTEGKVVGVYNGPYYAVNYPGVQGVCYSPDPHVTAVSGGNSGAQPAPVPGGGTPTPGPEGPAQAVVEHAQRVGSWERLMGLVRRGGPASASEFDGYRT